MNQNLMAVAGGKKPADLVIKNGKIVKETPRICHLGFTD